MQITEFMQTIANYKVILLMHIHTKLHQRKAIPFSEYIIISILCYI